MKPRAVVVDTNVVIAGLLTGSPDTPTARILDGMVEGRFVFVVSTALVVEYRRVLLAPRIRGRHGLSERQVDELLTAVVANAVVREPRRSSSAAPDPGDQHLWDLLATEAGAVLVTGDRALLERSTDETPVVSPAQLAQEHRL